MAKVYCFGNTANGELGLGGIEEEHILSPRKQRLSHDRRKYSLLQLASGRNHTLLLLRNVSHDRNSVFSCGSNERLQLGRVGSWKKLEIVDALSAHNIIQISSGSHHCLVLSEAGQLFSWGCNLFGQLGIGSREQQEIGKPSLVKALAVKHIIQIACGGNHCLALTKNGQLFAWGSNAFGQLGIGSHGNCMSTPMCITTLQWTPIRQISAGGSHSAILSCTGALYIWGKNEFGQLGLNDSKNRYFPILQTSLRNQNISYIDLGEEHSAAITKEGGLFTWGAGMYGQLGHGRNMNEILPRQVFELMGNNISQVSCGRCHTLVATEHGRLFSFGLNGSGQLGIGSTQSKNVPTYVNGSWIEINIKDLLLRNEHRTLCMIDSPQRENNPEINASTEIKSSKPNVSDSSKSSTVDSAMQIDEIDEINDDDNSTDNESTNENFIIEEPDDIYTRPSNLTPEFLCKDNTVFTTTNRDCIKIDEYESDPDSDITDYDFPQQTVLKEVVASKGDQSFILIQPYSPNVCPQDFRKVNFKNQILQLNNSILERFKDISKDSIPSDILDYIEDVFGSFPCWNASYIKNQSSDFYFDKNPKFAKFMISKGINLDDGIKINDGLIDWSQAFLGFDMIEDAENPRIDELILESVDKILEIMPDVHPVKEMKGATLNEEVLRVFQLLPLFHLFRMSDLKNGQTAEHLISKLCKCVRNSSEATKTTLQIWWACTSKHYLKNLVHIIKRSIEYNLLKQHEENKISPQPASQQQPRSFEKKVHQNLADCLEVLKLLYTTNKFVEVLSYKEFYINGIADMFDLKLDYTMWRQSMQTHDTMKYFLCNYSFIFDVPAKNFILAVDSEMQQQSAAESSIYRQLLYTQPIDGQIYVNPYLTISVHRNTILQETINQLCLLSKHDRDFKRPLQVYFEGEEAIDAGQGMKKEFFLLLMKEILDEQYGMFMEYKETNTIWFHHCNDEDDVMYSLIGILCGLAIYNKVIINLPFPLVLYKKLLKETLELDDLAYLDPLLCKNLKDILVTSYKQEEFDAIFGDLNFTITLQTFGSPVEFELCPDGKSRRLTYENRQEYVRLYWQYILETSIEKQFESFKKGFLKVLDTGILKIFHAEELMQLVSGQEVSDWEELESVTEYKPPFNKDHPTIKLFWRVFHAFTNEEKKKFLLFLTGSDRIPILGVKALHLVIQSMKVSEEHLPVAHTCFNVLDLPETYTSEDRESKLRTKLLKACEFSKGFALV